jgi:hypothetical protein
MLSHGKLQFWLVESLIFASWTVPCVLLNTPAYTSGLHSRIPKPWISMDCDHP